MYRGTTPQHDFLFDVDPQLVFRRILITYAQNGKVVLTKTKNDLTYEEVEDPETHEISYKASFKMTQQEANSFDGSCPYIQLQMRFMDNNNHVVASPIVKIRLENVLNDEVLTWS